MDSAQGRYHDALARYGEALPLFIEIGDRRGEAEALLAQGRALAATGSLSAALVLSEAARIFDLLGLADRAEVARQAAAGGAPASG